MDKRFVDKHLPELAKKCHYRVVDVTSFKEVFRSKWNVNVPKAEGHRALDDIRESIRSSRRTSRSSSCRASRASLKQAAILFSRPGRPFARKLVSPWFFQRPA
jgi:hypothetical protein